MYFSGPVSQSSSPRRYFQATLSADRAKGTRRGQKSSTSEYRSTNVIVDNQGAAKNREPLNWHPIPTPKRNRSPSQWTSSSLASLSLSPRKTPNSGFKSIPKKRLQRLPLALIPGPRGEREAGPALKLSVQPIDGRNGRQSDRGKTEYEREGERKQKENKIIMRKSIFFPLLGLVMTLLLIWIYKQFCLRRKQRRDVKVLKILGHSPWHTSTRFCLQIQHRLRHGHAETHSNKQMKNAVIVVAEINKYNLKM